MTTARPATRLSAALAAAALTVAAGPAAHGQLAREVEGQRATGTAIMLDTGRPVVPRQSVPGRVYSSDGRLSVGAVRNLRPAPLFDPFTAYSRYNRFDRSDRWLAREIILGRIDPYRVEKSIGVVRAYRQNPYIDVREAQRGVLVFTNPNAPDAAPSLDTSDLQPSITGAGGAGTRRVSDLDEATQNDPWALLDEGFYRDARAMFEAAETPDAATRTGAALAAAMLGDLDAAADLMPDGPTLPDGVTLSDATRTRLRQLGSFLYQDDPAMQRAMTTLAGPDPTPAPDDAAAK